MENFRAIVNEMAARGGAAEVADAEELVKAVRQLLGNPQMRSEMAAAAADIASTKEAILDTVLDHLDTVLAGIAARARGDETATQKNSLKNGSHAGP